MSAKKVGLSARPQAKPEQPATTETWVENRTIKETKRLTVGCRNRLANGAKMRSNLCRSGMGMQKVCKKRQRIKLFFCHFVVGLQTKPYG
jgi:hypothetical protein